jgi:hypothetical protein
MPTVAELPVDQFASIMQDIIASAKGNAETAPQPDPQVAELDKRISNIENMLSQLLDANQATPAAQPMPPPQEEKQASIALDELKLKRKAQAVPLMQKLKRIGVSR